MRDRVDALMAEMKAVLTELDRPPFADGNESKTGKPQHLV